jgi:hypothetical protein
MTEQEVRSALGAPREVFRISSSTADVDTEWVYGQVGYAVYASLSFKQSRLVNAAAVRSVFSKRIVFALDSSGSKEGSDFQRAYCE